MANASTRARYHRTDLALRVARERERHIVPLGQRPLDDGIVDDIAVDLALRGWRGHGANLRRAELVEAIRIGRDRGLSTLDLADLLHLYEREVQRLRAETRPAEPRMVAEESHYGADQDQEPRAA